MRRLIFIALLLALPFSGHAQMTLLMREMFTNGPVNSASPDQFTAVTNAFYPYMVGPYTTNMAAPGWSADVLATNSVGYCDLTTGSFTNAAKMGCMIGFFRFNKFPAADGANKHYTCLLGLSHNFGVSSMYLAVGITNNGCIYYQETNIGTNGGSGFIFSLNTWYALKLEYTNTGSKLNYTFAWTTNGSTWVIDRTNYLSP